MIKILDTEHINDIMFLLKKYHKDEDKFFEIVLSRSRKELEELIATGYIYGKFINKNLVGIASLHSYNSVVALQKTCIENKSRKEIFFKENDITPNNTALILNDLIDISYRDRGIYKDLNRIRLLKIKALNYKNIVAYLNINKAKGINEFLDNGWKFGTLIKVGDKQYEMLMYFKIR